jgi:hypothetical protein
MIVNQIVNFVSLRGVSAGLFRSGIEKRFGSEPQKAYNTKALGGAGDRDRTDDIQLGKLTFYH